MSNVSKKCSAGPKASKKSQEGSNMQTFSQTSWLNLNGKNFHSCFSLCMVSYTMDEFSSSSIFPGKQIALHHN